MTPDIDVLYLLHVLPLKQSADVNISPILMDILVRRDERRFV